MPTETLAQLGAMGIILIFAIKEFFAFLRVKAGEGRDSGGLSKEILAELQLMNNNHLHTLQDALHSDNMRIIELLGEIKGGLQNRP